MNRRGLGYIECVVFLLALMALMPLLGQLGVETFRSLQAPERVLRLRQLAQTCDRIRREAEVGGWSQQGEELRLGGETWSSRDGSILRDGALHLNAASLEWRQRADGWLLIELAAEGSRPRVLCLRPEDPR